MANEPKGPAATAEESPAIENEVPAYRAIDPLAVLALVLGVASALCFADLYFLVAAAGAVVVGIVAERKIRRLADVLTGLGLARAGIALGVIFGLSAVTYSYVSDWVLRREAASFARRYVHDIFPEPGAPGAAEGSPIATAVWYQMPPANRRGLSPNGALEMLRRSAPDIYESQTRGVRTIQDRLHDDPAHRRVTFAGLERVFYDGVKPKAYALLRVAGPPTERHKDAEQFALLALEGERRGPRIHWFVETVVFPYQPNTYVPRSEPVDDGHGHGH